LPSIALIDIATIFG